MCLLARTSSIKSAFLFLCFPGFREEPFFWALLQYTLIAAPADKRREAELTLLPLERYQLSMSLPCLSTAISLPGS
ncbi:hypothetical protein CJF36_22460 [Pseudomonas lundensis]|nr:hypothetical protein CJF36_22460 [Pseudomonas lundensis]